MHRARHEGAFTLIEIAVVVAIIGILAATAAASFQNYQFRSRRTESLYNLKSIASTQTAYYAEHSVYTGAPAMPGPGLGSAPRPWTLAADAAFAVVGWRPEGSVFFDYDVNVPGGPAVTPCPACTDCFTASAYGDIDADGLVSVAMYVHPDSLGAFCPASVTGDLVPVDGGGTPLFDMPVRNSGTDDF
jgi:prepilin-type N-terminal cleavage/methylation domain-containing protein